MLQVVGDPSGGELESLHDWLDHESDLRGRVTAAQAEPTANQLGVGADTLSIAVGAGGAISVLASALKGFFAQPRRTDITITIQTRTGTRIDLDAKNVKDVDALLSRLTGGGE